MLFFLGGVVLLGEGISFSISSSVVVVVGVLVCGGWGRCGIF